MKPGNPCACAHCMLVKLIELVKLKMNAATIDVRGQTGYGSQIETGAPLPPSAWWKEFKKP